MLKNPTEFRERFQRWKKGEQVYENGLALPAYEDGLTPHKKSEVNTNQATYNPEEDLYTARYTLPEVTVTGTNKHQPWSANKSVALTNRKWNNTDFKDVENMALIAGGGIVPGISDIGDVAASLNSLQNKDYINAGFGAGLLLLPNVIEKPVKMLYKSARKVLPRQLVHDILTDPKRVITDKINGNYAFTEKGRDKIIQKGNQKLTWLGTPVIENAIQDELIQRRKRINFLSSHGYPTGIIRSNNPVDRYIGITYSKDMNPRYELAHATNPIEVAFYENPKNSFFRLNRTDDQLKHTIGHEFVHRLQKDNSFSPWLKASDPGKNGYYYPSQTNPMMHFSDVQSAFNPTIRRSNINLQRIAEAETLKQKYPDFNTSVWLDSPDEVVADLRSLYANKKSDSEIYDYMWKRHGYMGEDVDLLRNLGF